MEALADFLPHLIAMAALTAASGFFSCSEAALFYLGRDDRRLMSQGGAGERAAAHLLEQPDRLLTSILFWNLVINMAYFALSSVVTLGLEKAGAAQQATGFAVAALLAIIVVSEMLPKNLGVLWPRRLASFVGLPLSLATRALDPVMPAMQKMSDLGERLVAPQFSNEPYLELADLERAIILSGSDPALIEQESNILSRVVALSEAHVEEVMRPRRNYLAFSPPVTAADLDGQTTPSGYLLITEPDSEEIAAALPIERAALLPHGERLDYYAEPVAVVPWCATAAATLGELRLQGRRVAAVLNELGETIGIVTTEDLLTEVLQPNPAPRHPKDWPGRMTIDGDAWQATGRATLRRIAKQIGRRFPETKTITVAGLFQEQLQRLPEVGDVVIWGGLRWEAIEVSDDTGLLVTVAPEQGDTRSTPVPGAP